jgi:Zn-dependent protease
MVFYKSEIAQMLISVLTISLAFSLGFLVSFPLVLLTVGIGFIAHEIGHKIVALRFGCRAVYKMWVEGLILALVFAFATAGRFIFAAPGAVYIYKPGMTRRENGLISLAGPLTNVALAFVFFFLILTPAPFLQQLGAWGFKINLFFAMFNLLPVPPLDGSKVMSWNPSVWLIVMVVSAVLFFFPQVLYSLI